MNRFFHILWSGMMLFALCEGTPAEEVVLTAAKDSFLRSNKQIGNSGGSEHLIVAPVPNIRTLIGFDLSGITNLIEKAELRVRMKTTMPQPMSLMVAPLVPTANNRAWGEGHGNLGVLGQNSRVGDASYLRSAAPDIAWESADEKPAKCLISAGVWKAPVVVNKALTWTDGEWFVVPIGDVSCLKTETMTEDKIVTFGLWGTSGNGVYFMHSKESSDAPQLVLTLKDDSENE